MANLPPDSAYRRSTGQWWTSETELAAAQVEHLHALIGVTARAYGYKGRWETLRIARPGDPKKRPFANLKQSMQALAGGR